MSESMAGRFEIIPIPHWSFKECEEAFGLSLDEYIFFGGYPGALPYRNDEERFFSYIQDAIVDPVISTDIVFHHLITKPTLLRELFRLGSAYSGQILAFNKMLGQLQDAGNTTTLAHYLTLFDQTFVLRGLYKYTTQPPRQRQSPPKFQVYNAALQTNGRKMAFKESMMNTDLKGRLVESCVGAYLVSCPNTEIFYWRENNQEVDFVVKIKEKILAIEVKSGERLKAPSGLELFSKNHPTDAKLLVGSGGIPLDIFLKTPLEHFI